MERVEIMLLLNIGSLNIDNVYNVNSFLQPGETKTAIHFSVNCGGKGLNQSIAAARAGCDVWHAGLVGYDGEFLVNKLDDNRVNTQLVHTIHEKSGHAVIQVNSSGQNCILLYPGTNRMLSKTQIDSIFNAFPQNQAVLLQNEVNELPYIIDCAKQNGHKVFLNAAPMDENILHCNFNNVDWLIINEVEGMYLAKCKESEEIISALQLLFPTTNVLLTLGENGAVCRVGDNIWSIPSRKVQVIDTTAAGDTFTGYFIKCILDGNNIPYALYISTLASSICVGRLGAADSVPICEEVFELKGDRSVLPKPIQII